MKQIDLGPESYKREDPETGEMKHPVNRQVMRAAFYIALATVVLLAALAMRDGYNVGMILAPALIGGFAGGAFILSLRRPDW